MRRLYGWLSLASACGLCGAIATAADPAPSPPPAIRYAPAVGSPAPEPAALLRAQAAEAQKSVPSFADRMRAAQQARQQQQAIEANRPLPTQWQLQNPANSSNLVPTQMNGPVAPNTYFGPQFHSWSNVQQPATMTQLPFNQTATTPINQTNLYTAPNVYFGSQFSGWNNLRNGNVEPNAFGGWNYR
ncbi:MAG TPA: hypothetical protein VFG20_00570 [Planctomycetaceae bacterium]|nr:hypothetical protein [Planctomycetaceae bacterium]